MKRYFKYIAVLLSFVMVFSLSGFAALQTLTNVFAADSPSAGDNSGDEQDSDWEYTENEDGTLKLTKYVGNDKYLSKVTLPSEFGGKKVTVIGEDIFYYGINDSCHVEEIIVPEGVTRIENFAFMWSGASVIRLPESLVEVEGIGAAFSTFSYSGYVKVYGYRNSAVEKVIDSSDFAVFYLAEEPYPEYNSMVYKENSDGTLTIVEYKGSDLDVVVPQTIDGKAVTGIEKYAFYRKNVKSVQLPDGLKKIGGCAFNYVTNLESVNIPDSVTTIGYNAFYGCNLKKIVIPASVVNLGSSAFSGLVTDDGEITAGPIGSGCDVEFGWTEELPDYAFYGLKITDITLPDTIKSIGYYSLANNNFKSVTFPENIKSIGRYAFSGCANLENVTIPAGVSSVGANAFFNTSGLESVTFLGGDTEIGEKLFYTYQGVQNTIIKGLTNSTAEEYAKANDITFESIGIYEKPTEPDTEAPTEAPSETPSETPGEEPSETPSETPSKPETPIDSDVLDSINNGEKVVTKEVEAGNGSVVPTDFVAVAIEKRAQLVLEVKGMDGNPLVKYTFDGSKFTKAPDANFKLDVACGEKNAVTAKVKEQLNTADENSLFLCDFEHSGELNGELAVTVYPNYDNGTELKLFYYNEATGKAEDMGQTVKVENGEVTFTVTHFSSYLLVKASDIRNDVTPSEPGTTEPGNNPSEPGTTNPETTPSETQPAQPETTANQTETESASTEPESGSYVAPSTGAGAGSAAALVGVMLMACGAAGVCVGKRKK